MRTHLLGAARPVSLAAGIALAAVDAQAACPIQLAVYGEAQSGAEIDFTPAGTSATITNAFRVILDNNVVLDGIAMWTEGSAGRPHGSLMYKCPTGDVTGEELAACTIWEGVIYSADEKGGVGLLPAEGADAPKSLILPDLGPSLEMSAAYGPAGFSKVSWDIFVLKGCQE
ncbi:hypothetical protein EN828_24465 [Mesorhizobium sp. M2D.F.Ca.ET.185.01.1.1]|uniref:hypothetical protein n=1 Tax=unclassified Mesorhizobium TaxID=325217 RepID=UPI000FCA9580|nr:MULTISPECIES: hypothetical protein [unclassified Mesorhizobium]TGP48188.1 hypothetical protein EN873_34880 [bacterium M00.F.Ca.ET.230.01.1.1]TGP75694.1 hypothetical protein EN870_23555 [bacterium M00.F.Ca.ET.227.01.1.1]TGP87176.1 hypothetical protein EN864_23320 [bacterium M00.F.Ca.ET.221.01.1.1]TGP91667.1 hypothetical protein EN865_21990 [bacterium M00.F.Ca.ET.222.01.1.1]TGU04077.1 hypothetical protein EN806_40165 [bacterium M00.F.Ca.ET.163.01.1.1]TGU23279.1 hypothetical protein EN799_501